VSLKEACLRKGGIWDYQIGCKVEEKIPDSDVVKDRIYYDTTERKCLENGDNYVPFFEDINACKKLSVREFCENKSNIDSLFTCARTVEFPERKIFQVMEEEKPLLPDIYSHQKMTKNLRREAIENQDIAVYKADFYGSVKLTTNEVDYALEKEKVNEILLSRIISKNILTNEQIWKIFKIADEDDASISYLPVLYKTQNLDHDQILYAIDKARYLGVLYWKRKLTKEEVSYAIDKGFELGQLYANNTLTREQIDWILFYHPKKINQTLYSSQKLTREQVDKSIELREYITSVIKHQNLNLRQLSTIIKDNLEFEQVMDPLITRWGEKLTTNQRFYILDHARQYVLETVFQKIQFREDELRVMIQKGNHLKEITYTQKLTDDLARYYIDEGRELHLLYNWMELSPAILQYALDKGLYLDRIIKRYRQKLTNTQIDQIIEQGKSLNTLYESWSWDTRSYLLKPYQVDAAVEKGIALLSLANHYDLTDDHKNHIINNASEKELNDFFISRNIKLNREQIDTAILRGVGTYSLFAGDYKLEPYQKYRAIEVGKNLDALFYNHTLTEKMIDAAIEKGNNLDSLYSAKKHNYYYSDKELKHVLNKEQVDKALEKGVALGSLYEYQTLTTSQITKAVEKELYLHHLLKRYTFTNKQKDMVLELGKEITPYIGKRAPSDNEKAQKIERLNNIAESLSELYKTQSLDKEQIETAININWDLSIVYEKSKDINLGDELYLKALKKDKGLYELFKNHGKYFSWNIIDKAIDNGENIDVLYSYIKPTSEEKNKILEKGIKIEEFYRNHADKFSKDNFKKAIELGHFLSYLYRHDLSNENIYTAMKKGDFLNVLYSHQTLNTQQVDLALEMEKNLHELYEHQKLTTKQRKRAIEIGKDIDNLWTYHQADFTKEDIDLLIEKRKILNILQKSPLVINEQKLRILDILGISTEAVSKSKFLREISPHLVFDAKSIFDEAVNNKIKEHPLKPLVGSYIVPKTPWDEIIDKAKEEGFEIKNEQYAYKGNTKQRIGYLLSKWKDKKLLRSYQILRSQKTPLPTEYEELEIRISDDPEEVAMQSTGQKWESCVTVGHSCGGGENLAGPHNGWRDDIKANNLVAYLWKKGEDMARARCVIRWCNREDDGLPDAYVEQPHSHELDAKYREIIKDNLLRIVQEKGFTGKSGPIKCITPYDFSGYVDTYKAFWGDEPITYKVAEKPEVKHV
jgi:hypothetical protein